jgi:hypothetical protein
MDYAPSSRQAMTKPLSPAAQAVLDAFTEDNSLHDWKHNHYNTEALAAALRAAADQVVPLRRKPLYADSWEESAWTAEQDTRAELLAIAAELEAQ